MPIVIKTASTSTNTPVVFDFGAPVMNYVVGVAYWKFAFGGGDDHHVMRLGMTVRSNKNDKQVQSMVVANLEDAHGASIDNANSTVRLVCIAVTVSEDTNYAMANVEGAKSGYSVGNLGLYGTSSSFEVGLLSGWNLEYVGDDHHMKRLQLQAAFAKSNNVGMLSGSAQMADDTGKVANGSVNGGIFWGSPNQSGLLCRLLPALQTEAPVPVDFGRKIKDGAAILQELFVSFSGEDHHIKTIGGGASSWTPSGSVLTLANARVFMTDSSGHSQDNRVSSSYVSLVAFGVPA